MERLSRHLGTRTSMARSSTTGRKTSYIRLDTSRSDVLHYSRFRSLRKAWTPRTTSKAMVIEWVLANAVGRSKLDIDTTPPHPPCLRPINPSH